MLKRRSSFFLPVILKFFTHVLVVKKNSDLSLDHGGKTDIFLRKITGSERKETCYKKRMLDHVDAWPNQEEIPSIKIIFIAKTLSVITE